MAKFKPTKYIFVTGGVASGIGKGIAAAAMAKILQARGFAVNMQKCDPYINTDAGTLNPGEHGEVYVTADGAETDLDLGHYERFLDKEMTTASSTMSGEILSKVINDERAGKYLGKTVQIIPHVTTAIQDAIILAGKGFDIHIVELGGTVGDYEGLAFLEAIRAIKYRVGQDNVLHVNVVFLPHLAASNELKTKPAQNAVRALRSTGIQPDILMVRADRAISEGVLKKLSMYCDVPVEAIAPLGTARSVYQVPLALEKVGIGDVITKQLGLGKHKANLKKWTELVGVALNEDLPKLRIAMVAKYLDHEDTYMSVSEAIKSAAWHSNHQVEIIWINAEKLGKSVGISVLDQVDGIIVPGGFGERGIEGKIKAAQYAMDHQVPYLGLCLGMQVAVIALARRVLGAGANSTEFNKRTKYPVISLMAEQLKIKDLGGTMRLGNYTCKLASGTQSRKLYGTGTVQERHRHRYEFNNKYRRQLERAGLVVAGVYPAKNLVEIIEFKGHPYFVGTQFHPELKSRLEKPHPLFVGLMKAAIEQTHQ